MGFLKKVGNFLGSVASPLIGGAFGIGSALLGNKAQSDTNKQNMRIAQMNNEWSERMMEKQHAYDLALWEKNAAYNDPSAQVERLKNAGLNPSMMMGNGSTGVAQGGSSVGMPTPTVPNIQPMRYDGFANAINNVVQQSMMISKNNADIDAIGRTQDREDALARARITEMMEETRSKKFKNELNEITKDLQVSNMNEDFLRKVQERANMEEQKKLIQQQIIAQQLINSNMPEKIAMEVAVMASQRDLNEFNSEHEVGKLVSTLKKRGYKLSKPQENAIFESVITVLENDAWKTSSPWSLIGQTLAAARRYKTKYQEYAE